MGLYHSVLSVKKKVYDLMTRPAAGVPCSYGKTDPKFAEAITFKKKYFCTVFASPTSGKSEWVLQECIYLATDHGWKTLLFTPEQGDSEEIVAALVFKKTGKSVQQIPGIEQIREEELELCLNWLHKYFIIVDSEEGITMEGIFKVIDELHKEHGWVIDNVVIDNHNDLDNPIVDRQDLAIEKEMTYLRRQCKKRDMYAFLVTHTSAYETDKVGNITFLKKPDPTKIRGGGAFHRKAFLLINLWRPPLGLKDENDIPYVENQSVLTVFKAKPTFTGVRMFIGDLFWDRKKSRFTTHPGTYKTF